MLNSHRMLTRFNICRLDLIWSGLRYQEIKKNLVWYINLVSYIRIYSSPDFDFHVPGVSSMSLDTHKYGYALKGTSVCLYANKELRQAQYFCYADWTGGLYTTPTLAGTFITHILRCVLNCWPYRLSISFSLLFLSLCYFSLYWYLTNIVSPTF